MKKNYLYILLIALFAVTVSFVVIRYQKKQHTAANIQYILLARNGNTDTAEWNAAKRNTDQLIAKLKQNPKDSKSALALANAWIMESRISGNIAYYDMAAMKSVEQVLANEPDNYEALTLLSLLQLSQHHFADGLATATKAKDINPNNAFVYGLLVDGNVEMGNYPEALEAADQMVTIRPDLRSYSRIAYLREIFGDYAGAIDAMKMAVEAGMPAQESTEWCRIQLGRLYENVGAVDRAKLVYQTSLAARPGYAYALAGLGRIASFEQKPDSAVYYFQQAVNLVSDLGVKEGLAIALANAGQAAQATELNTTVISEMNKNAKAAIDDPTVGHYSDKELAYAYLQNKDVDKAIEHALAEYNRRPKNIDVNQTMAWVLFKQGKAKAAQPFIDSSMTTHTMSPVFLCTAGLIYTANGDKEKGKNLLQQGLRYNPVIPEDLRSESMAELKKL